MHNFVNRTGDHYCYNPENDNNSNDPGNANDCDGHGTHVAGTIGGTSYGVAKQITLKAVRVLDCSGNGFLDEVVGGIDWITAYAQHPAVANMSLGPPVGDDRRGPEALDRLRPDLVGGGR